jgi:predicted enzyme related to lactoylglutathione lyase
MAHLAHFSINADDVNRARTFYGNVFGWKFDPWGPPGFYMINTWRRELIAGQKMIGYECTISVPSIDETIRALKAQKGKLVMEKSVIAGVGTLVFFEDTEGNVAGAMEYEKHGK